MLVTFNFADEFTSTIAKVNTITTKVADLPEASLAKIFAYGLQRILNDAAGAGETADDKLALAQKRQAALLAGETGRAARTAKPGEDPVTAECRKLATKQVTEILKAKGLELSEEEFAAHVERRMTLAAIVTSAEATVAARKAKAAAKISPADLGDL